MEAILKDGSSDLANELLKCKDWEPADLHASVQKEIPPRLYLNNGIPFGFGRELIVDVPIDPRGYADVDIDDTTGLAVDLPGSGNAEQLESAIPLAIEVAARPNDLNEPIPREKMVSEDKLTAEGGLSETKVILGWEFIF
jgi:hypothetical protein